MAPADARRNRSAWPSQRNGCSFHAPSRPPIRELRGSHLPLRRHPPAPATPRELEAPAGLALGGYGRVRPAPALPGGDRRPRPLPLARHDAQPGARPVAGVRGQAPRPPRTPARPHHLPLLGARQRAVARTRVPPALDRRRDGRVPSATPRHRRHPVHAQDRPHDRIGHRLPSLQRHDPRRHRRRDDVGHAAGPHLDAGLGVDRACHRHPRGAPARVALHAVGAGVGA